MKNNFCRPRPSASGFTLVELLVVIAIIAILASVITVAASGAINAAKRAKAANMGTQIQTAILAFNTEYGVYPLPAGAAAVDVLYNTQGQEQPLFFALCGNINPYTPAAPLNNTTAVSNTRNIAFITPKRGEVDNMGVIYNQFTSQSAPQYYSIAMDGDYSGVLGDTGGAAPPDFVDWSQGSTAPAAKAVTQAVAVWACCDPANVTTPGNSTAPNLWVKTN